MENWTTENGQTTHKVKTLLKTMAKVTGKQTMENGQMAYEVKTLLKTMENHWKIDNGKWTNRI